MKMMFNAIKGHILSLPRAIRGLFYSFQFKKAGRMMLSSHFRLVNGKSICVGNDFKAGINMRVECVVKDKSCDAAPVIVIGEHVYFGDDCHIGAMNNITIGSGVLTGRGVLITDHSHGSTEFIDERSPIMRPVVSNGAVVRGDNVWLGDNVAVMPCVTIGEGAIIGVNSVVTKNIPAYAVAAGIPAKVIRILKAEGQDL